MSKNLQAFLAGVALAPPVVLIIALLTMGPTHG